MAHDDITDSNFDPTDVQLTVHGHIIREFAGIKGWRVYKETKLNQGPGGRAYGHNRQRGNNACTFRLLVMETSPDKHILDEIVDSQASGAILAEVVENLESYALDQSIAYGCEKGTLQEGEVGLGDKDEAETVEYMVLGIGPIRRRKEA